MSRNFQPKNKEYAQVVILSSSDVYDSDGKIKSGIDLVGKIDRDLPNMVIKANRVGKKTQFVEDTCHLTKKTKGEIVDFFKNEKTAKGNARKMAYVVKAKKGGDHGKTK